MASQKSDQWVEKRCRRKTIDRNLAKYIKHIYSPTNGSVNKNQQSSNVKHKYEYRKAEAKYSE